MDTKQRHEVTLYGLGGRFLGIVVHHAMKSPNTERRRAFDKSAKAFLAYANGEGSLKQANKAFKAYGNLVGAKF